MLGPLPHTPRRRGSTEALLWGWVAKALVVYECEAVRISPWSTEAGSLQHLFVSSCGPFCLVFLLPAQDLRLGEFGRSILAQGQSQGRGSYSPHKDEKHVWNLSEGMGAQRL